MTYGLDVTYIQLISASQILASGDSRQVNLVTMTIPTAAI